MTSRWVIVSAAFLSPGIIAIGCSGDPDVEVQEVCPESQDACSGVCVDLDTDPANCGRCGEACEAGSVCDGSGTCALSCQTGLTDCEGKCVDTTTDNANCGACGLTCDAGLICDGESMCSVTCQAGLIDCGGSCIDPMTNDDFCGANGDCTGANDGDACDDGFKCDGSGTCALSCQAGLIDCGGTCVDPSTNQTFCGATGDCTGANDGQICQNGFKCNGAGVCALSCQAGLIDCAGTCTDPLTSNAFCGASGDCAGVNDGETCQSGFKCNGAGVCALTCQAGLVECGATCIDPDSNPSFCGASDPCNLNPGVQCTADQACVDGGCADVACNPIGGFSGTNGPTFTDGCWRQCAGWVDVDDGAGGDQIPVAWGQACNGVGFNTVRVVCGNTSNTVYRYIDLSKNIFRDGLASYPESGLIINARDQNGSTFAIQSNNIYADGDDPNTGVSWFAGDTGFCSQTSNIMTINNIPTVCREVDDCLGLSAGLVGQNVFLGVYVLD